MELTPDGRVLINETCIANVLSSSVQFLKMGEGFLDVIQGVGAARMARELDALPGGQVQENLAAGFFQLFLDKLDFLFKTDAERVFFRVGPEFVQLVLQFGDRLFEIELMLHAWEILKGFIM